MKEFDSERGYEREVEMRTYPIVCPSCGGTGYINNPNPANSATQITCPACNGSKTVTAIDDGEERRKESG